MTELLEGLDAKSAGLMLFEIFFIVYLMIDKKNLAPFVARKLCHSVSGCMMMLLNCNALASRLFIYSVAGVSLVMTWELAPSIIPNFWFAASRDVGITVYLILVALWVYWGFSLRILFPVFLADPAGAVVGKWATRNFPSQNMRWMGQKTIAGSLAVFVVTFMGLYRPVELVPRLLVSFLAMFGEAVGGAYDNLVIALVVIVSSGVVDLESFDQIMFDNLDLLTIMQEED